MSRAFVKEADGDDFADDVPERPVSSNPNYVTARGLRLIDEEIARLQKGVADAQASDKRSEVGRHSRDLRYWVARRTTAQVIAAAQEAVDVVSFGSLVTFERGDGTRVVLRIVGEDESDPTAGRVSWCAPVAKALAGNGVGDLIEIPNGEVEIVALDQTPEA
jgi:transcription elongation GreA/GreB family factor